MLPKTLIRRACAGHPDAVTAVINNLRPRLTKMAGFYARNTGEDTDDLLQEAWVGLLDALAKVDVTIGDPEQFLLKHARWRLLDAVKRWRRRQCDTLETEHLEMVPSRDWETGLSEVWVTEFTGRLKPAQQEIVKNLLTGMTWREAGDRLGCTSANVAYHVRQIQTSYTRWNGQAPVRAERASELA